MTTTRKFYAAYNHYGIWTALGEYNAPFLHVFDSKRKRDEWVSGDWEHRQEITAAEFRKWKRTRSGNIVNH